MAYIGQLLSSGIESLLTAILNELIKFGMGILSGVLVTPFDFSAIPGYTELKGWLIAASLSWMAVLVAKEYLVGMYDGYEEIHPMKILQNTITSGVLITASPLIITGIILPATGLVLDEIQKVMGSASTLGHDMSSHLTLVAGTGFGEASIVALIPEGGFWVAVLVAASFLFVALWVAFSSGMRWIELIFLALIGPVLAISKASYNNSWDLWVRETIAVAASQSIQAFSVLLGMDLLLNPLSDIHAGANVGMYLFISIGSFIFAIRGPKTLRTILGAPSNGLKAAQSLAGNVAKAAAL